MLKRALLYFCCWLLLIAAGTMLEARGVIRGRGGVFVTPPLTGVSNWGTPTWYNRYPTHWVTGDTWFSTWGDDGKTYIASNDTQGWDAGSWQAMGISTITGPPWDNTAIGAYVAPNSLAGPFNGTGNSGSSDGSSWKSAGLLCVNVPGVGYRFYLNTRRIPVPSNANFHDSQIIKSSDHGASWSPLPATPATPYSPPMISGTNTLSGYFQYGQCYQTTGSNPSGPDGSGTYIYASVVDSNSASPTGWLVHWLGRVKITDIDALDITKWQWLQAADGTNDANWVSGLGTPGLASAYVFLDMRTYTGAAHSLSNGVCCGNSFQYLPRYQQYVYVGISSAPNPTSTSDYWTSIFAAPAPWGPWRLLGQYVPPNPYQLNWTNPIPASLVNGGQQMTIAASGNLSNTDYTSPTCYYQLNFQTVTFAP